MKLKLISRKSEAWDAVTFAWKPEEQLTWVPGQYMHYFLDHDGADDRGTERWFTIASAPFEKNLQITTRIFSDKKSSFKGALNDLPIGSEIEAEGPKGKFILEDAKNFHVFIAGGIGVTPFRSMFLESAHDRTKLNGVLLYANHDKQFYFKDELDEAVAKQSNLRIEYFVEKEIDEKSLLEYVPNGIKPLFYVSGPEPMVEHYEKMLLVMGFTQEQVKGDFFPGYVWPP